MMQFCNTQNPGQETFLSRCFQAQEHRGIKLIRYQSSITLMHIYGESEETHFKEYQWKLWGGRFIHRPVGK